MPVLPNPKHELFAQALARGENASKAYVCAGFKGSRANASRLRANGNIVRRVFELSEAAAASCEISIQSVCKELDEAIALAKTKGQPNALVNAANLRAKLGGLLVEKQQVEVTDKVEFDGVSSVEDILREIVADLGIEIAVALAQGFKLGLDETAILALCNDPNGSAPRYGQRAIGDCRPPRPDPKRQVG